MAYRSFQTIGTTADNRWEDGFQTGIRLAQTGCIRLLGDAYPTIAERLSESSPRLELVTADMQEKAYLVGFLDAKMGIHTALPTPPIYRDLIQRLTGGN